MRHRLFGCAVLLSLALAGAARAECTVSSDAGASVRKLDATVQADANLLVSMTMLPSFMHIDYAAAARRKPACDLGQLAPERAGYELWGDDTGERQRKALPAKAGEPIALLMPVVDLLKAIEGSKQGKTAQVEAYLLATVGKSDFTGWRVYTGMPEAATLKHDMAEVLAGGATPIFRSGADGKVSLFLPKD